MGGGDTPLCQPLILIFFFLPTVTRGGTMGLQMDFLPTVPRGGTIGF